MGNMLYLEAGKTLLYPAFHTTLHAGWAKTHKKIQAGLAPDFNIIRLLGIPLQGRPAGRPCNGLFSLLKSAYSKSSNIGLCSANPTYSFSLFQIAAC